MPIGRDVDLDLNQELLNLPWYLHLLVHPHVPHLLISAASVPVEDEELREMGTDRLPDHLHPTGHIVRYPRSSLWLFSCELQLCVNHTTARFQRPVLISSLAQMLIPSSF